jgi:hypothetical protein
MNRLLIAPLLLVASAQLLRAQDLPERPADGPDAAAVVQAIIEGRRGPPISTALRVCPPQNPYGDTVWSAVLGLDPTPDVVGVVAPAWSDAARRCADPRIDVWFRARAVEARTVVEASPGLAGLFGNPTPENLAVLKQIAFDEHRDDETRIFVLQNLASSPEERLDLYLEAHVAAPMPESHRFNEARALLESPVGDRFLTRALATIRDHPGRGSERLLLILADVRQVRSDPGRRAQVEAAIREIVSAPEGRYPRGLVDAALGAREKLTRAPPS